MVSQNLDWVKEKNLADKSAFRERQTKSAVEIYYYSRHLLKAAINKIVNKKIQFCRVCSVVAMIPKIKHEPQAGALPTFLPNFDIVCDL